MMEWVMNTPETAPAFVLARAGYDVWMGNNRGSKYSNTHKTLNKSDHAFWDFYQEDMAMLDLPALITFIKDKTGLEKIGYVGHSEGTTQMFMGGSLNPNFFRVHINLAVMVGPVASTANIPTPAIRFAAKHIEMIEQILVKKLNMYNAWGPEPIATEGIITFCHFFSDLCKAVMGIFNHEGVDNPERFPMYMSNLPSGTSFRTFVYYAQMINDNR